jgi:chromatin segregation and condensation protein Rec8/ScpA/Scc1 (kleisin family)
VATFLAVLELARLHLIRLHQTEDGEVILYRTTREPTTEELEGISG